jgi:ribosome-associated translation inhibitor RaiA
MDTPIQIVFHGAAHCATVASDIRERLARLEHRHPSLMRCHVTIEQPGGKFNVRLALRVPGEEIVVHRDTREDLLIALESAFNAARRALDEQTGRRARAPAPNRGAPGEGAA